MSLTASRFRRCGEDKTTRSNRMKFRLPLPTASTVYTPNAVLKLNRECFFLSLKRQVNSNPTTCSYIPKDYEKRSSTVSHWLKVLTTVTYLSIFTNRLPIACGVLSCNRLDAHVSSLQPFVNIQQPLEPKELIQTITLLKGLCQLESMRSEVMQITFNCQNSIVFNAWLSPCALWGYANYFQLSKFYCF